MIVEENRARREFNCIKRRLVAIPESFVKKMIDKILWQMEIFL